MEKRRLNNKGFTLVEMLVVVAIIAILVGVSIAVVGVQIEKAREATDLANVRIAYSKVMEEVTLGSKTSENGVVYDSAKNEYSMSIALKQTLSGWDTNDGDVIVAGLSKKENDGTQWHNEPSSGAVCKVYFSDMIHIDWNASKWSNYNYAGKIATSVKKGYYYGGTVCNSASEENSKELSKLAEELKKQNGWDTITLASDTNNAYTIKDKNGKTVNAVMVSYAEGTYVPNQNTNSKGKVTRMFFDPEDGTLIAVWTQSGSWGLGDNSAVGFWGSGTKEIEYPDGIDWSKYTIRDDVQKPTS